MWSSKAPLLLLTFSLIFFKFATASKRNVTRHRIEKRTYDEVSTSFQIEPDNGGNNNNNNNTNYNATENIFDAVSSALKMPATREKIDEVVPIVRSTSTPQKLVMGTLIASKISSENETGTRMSKEVRSLFGHGNNDHNRNNSADSDFSGKSGNATRELMLPISMDIASVLADNTSSEESASVDEDEVPEALPEAQELRYVGPGKRRRPIVYHQTPSRRPGPPPPPSVNRRNVFPDSTRSSLFRPGSKRRPVIDGKRGPSESDCTFFTKTVCLEAADYPYDAISRSLRSNKDMIAALLTDYKVQGSNGRIDEDLPISLSLENRYSNKYENKYEVKFENNEIKRRADLSGFDNVEEGFTCPSQIKYARPQLARAASGLWKYIINTGEHTQTLRLEKCSTPKSSCSFISENYRSSCVQVYNYHRLLTWDSKLGLHMDIFKIPTCCSCHVLGYAELFPPHQKDPPLKQKEPFPGAEFVADDPTDDDQDYKKPLSYLNKFNGNSHFDSNYVSSNKKPILESSPSRPSLTIPGRTRGKKPSSSSSSSASLRPFDKLPQQHAPNTRAPGYTGSVLKGSSNRPGRPNRPFRRDSTAVRSGDNEKLPNTTVDSRYNQQQYDQEIEAISRLQSGGFDDEYQHEPNRRVNYNYHPIIDFFKPEAAMLQSSEFSTRVDESLLNNSETWKPIVTS